MDEVMGLPGEAEDDDVIPLMSNQICPWTSRETYFSAHYDLLRDAVAYVRENHRVDSREVHIHEEVCIVIASLLVYCNN